MLSRGSNALQDGPKDCGVCCLLAIIRHYKGNVSKEYLRNLTHTTTDGVNFYNLLQAAKKIGFQGRGVKGELEKLDSFMLPCIAHVIIDNRYQHFIVIDEINFYRQTLIIFDPAQGKRKITFTEFKKISTNQYLYLKPLTILPSINSNHLIRNIIVRFLGTYKLSIFIIVILSGLYTILHIIVGFDFKFLLEYVLSTGSYKNATIISVFTTTLISLQLLFNFAREHLLKLLNHNFSHHFMQLITQQIITLPYSYYKNRTTGEIISRINECEQLQNFLMQLLGFVFIDLFQVIAIFIFLYYLNASLALFSFLFGFLGFALFFLLNNPIKELIDTTSEDKIKLQSLMIESINGVETIKGLHLEEATIEKIDRCHWHFLHKDYQLHFLLLVLNYIKEHLLQFGFILLLWRGSYLVIEKRLSLANLICFQTFYYYFSQPLQTIFSFIINIPTIKVIIRRITDLFDNKKEIFDYPRNRCLENLTGKINITNLCFRYQEHLPLLEDITINIPSQAKLVIYGPSGSGKSTLVKLLMKYYPINNNMIYLDDIDINQLSLSTIRNHISYVSQNEICFTDTIYNNIVLFNEVDYNLFLKVCHICRVDEIIKDKILGYDQMLEENGFNLSGGEKQRIVLARTILRDSAIYIFDEAFNQIDVALEREILKDLFNYLESKSVIVVSHRDHNQDLFKQKVVIKEGKCVC